MTVCPFCGLATESPHETQAACVEALQEEVTRVRRIVEQVERLKDEEPATRPSVPATSTTPPTTKD